MKRNKYILRMDGKIVAVKFAWNSARREILTVLRQTGTMENQAYCRVPESSDYYKDEFKNHIFGTETWTGAKTGRAVIFTIAKEVTA